MKNKVGRAILWTIAGFLISILVGGIAVGIISFICAVFGVTSDTHSLMQDVDQIERIELYGSCDFDEIVEIDPEQYTEFVEELCNIPTYYTTPPSCAMGPLTIKITYKNGEYEEVSEWGIARSGHSNIDGNQWFDEEAMAALFEKYGVPYEDPYED